MVLSVQVLVLPPAQGWAAWFVAGGDGRPAWRLVL
jgi:hypothetical protein